MGKNENLIKIFAYALNQEETMKGFYQSSLRRMAIGSAKKAIQRLIEEEDKHIDLLKRILQGLRHGPVMEMSPGKGLKLGTKSYFDKRAKAAFLKKCQQGSKAPDLCVFNTAWLMEKDISEFYEKMASQTEGEAQKAFLMLAQWEKDHEAFFKEYHDQLSDFYARMY